MTLVKICVSLNSSKSKSCDVYVQIRDNNLYTFLAGRQVNEEGEPRLKEIYSAFISGNASQ